MMKTTDIRRTFARTSDPLPRHEEYELIRRWQQEDSDAAARDQLIEANLRFVVDIAQEFSGLQHTDTHEMATIGAHGLLEAANRFDYTSGNKFITYAVWWIRQTMRDHANRNGSTIRLPINILDQLRRISQHCVEQEKEQGRTISLVEAAEAVGASDYQLAAHPLWDRTGHGYMSLDVPDEDGKNAYDYLHNKDAIDPAEELARNEQHQTLRALVKNLTSREQEVIAAYFGLDNRPPKTLEQIGQMLGLTRERIRQIKDKALAKLNQWGQQDLAE